MLCTENLKGLTTSGCSFASQNICNLPPYLLGFPNLSIKNPASTTTIAFLQKSNIRNTVLLEELHFACGVLS